MNIYNGKTSCFANGFNAISQKPRQKSTRFKGDGYYPRFPVPLNI